MKTFKLLLILFLSVLSFEMYGQVDCDIDDIKFLRVNVHFMLREAPLTPRNFTECDNGKGDDTFTGYDYAQSLVNKSNDNWSKNYQVNLFPGSTPPSYEVPKKVQLVLTGVYFHRDDNLYDAFPVSNDPANPPPASEIGETYGVDMDNTFNIFIMEKAPYVNSGGGFNKGGVVVSSLGFPVILLRNGWFSYPSNSGSNCAPCDAWTTSNASIYGTARGLNHELGHIFGLCHSFGGANPCAVDQPGMPADIDPFQECNDTGDDGSPITGSCTASGCHNFESGSNNLMGYNGLAHALTPCQIQIMNENILANLTDYIEMCCSDYTSEDISCDCAPNPAGTGALPLPGKFTTPGCKPTPYTICSPVNCPETPPNLLFPELDFQFADVDGNPGETFSICEDVFIDGDFSDTYIGYHILIQEVGDDGEGIWPELAQTGWWINDDDPSSLNITDLFENDNTPVEFEPGKTYQVRLGLKYPLYCILYESRQFTYELQVVDFDFVHEDGMIDNSFDICEDIYIDASASDFPVSYHHYTLWEVFGMSEIWIGTTAYPEGGPDLPLDNVNEAFAEGDTYWNSGQGPTLELEADKTYRLKLATYCGGDDWSEVIKEFTTYSEEICEPCEEQPFEMFLVDVQDGKCNIGFWITSGNPCHTLELTIYKTNGDVITQDFENTGGWITTIDGFNPYTQIVACVTFCGDNCVTTEEICLTITDEMIANCDDGMEPGPERPRSNPPDGMSEGRAAGDSELSGELNVTDQWLKIHPNPVSDKLYFKTNKALKGVSIYNTNSQIVQELDKTNLNEGQLNVDFLPEGIYFIRFINTDNEIEVKKIVKIK